MLAVIDPREHALYNTIEKDPADYSFVICREAGSMSQELEVLKDITERLTKAGIPYMVTGSVAMSFYARPRMTRDIDIVIHLSEDDVNRLVSLLGEAYYVPDMIREAISRPPHMINVIHEQYIVKVDFILRGDTQYAREAFKRRQSQDLFGQKVSVIAPEDLILSKLNWARNSHSEVQISDVRALLRTEGLDLAYLESWVQRLGLDAIWGMVNG